MYSQLNFNKSALILFSFILLASMAYAFSDKNASSSNGAYKQQELVNNQYGNLPLQFAEVWGQRSLGSGSLKKFEVCRSLGSRS